MRPTILAASDIDLIPRLRSLKSDGARLIFATSGRQCLGQLRDLTPELIIIDERLPDSRGSDIASRIKQVPRLKNVPLLMLLPEQNSDRFRTEAALIGANAVLVRPISSASLRALVGELLGPVAATSPVDARPPDQPWASG